MKLKRTQIKCSSEMQKLIDILEFCSIKGNSKQKSLQSVFKGVEGLSRPAAFRDLVPDMWSRTTERRFSIFSSDSWNRRSKPVPDDLRGRVVYKVAADHKCIEALNHSVLQKPAAGL